MKPTKTIKPAAIGSVSHGTLRPEDLLSSFADELLWQIQRNGHFFSLPENFALRDSLNDLHGEALDAFADDGETLEESEAAAELIAKLEDALATHFAGAYRYFGAIHGDGSDFGFWPNWDEIDELPTLADREPGEDYKEVNERGNVEVYRGDGENLFGIV